MQRKMTDQALSRYRQEFRQLIRQIERLTSRCLFSDPLIRGTAGEVYRTCGKPSCKCMKDKNLRHGPYYVIQVYRNGKQRQISLKQDEKELWDRTKHYQFQINRLAQLKEKCTELQQLMSKVIEARTEECPK